jgi:Golgi SNAP receptor complex protein 1
MHTSWERLRADARRLENEIENGLNEFAKACAALSGGVSGTLGESQWNGRLHHELERVEAQEAQLMASLRQLEETNQSMSSFAQGDQGNPALLPLLQRHHEVLAEYRIEYRRLRAGLRQLREYYELVGEQRASSPERRRGQLTVSRDHAASMTDLERGFRELESESAHMNGAHRAADASLGQSIALRDELMRQRQSFTMMFHRMTSMAESMPQLGRLITNIRRRKRRDMVMVASAAGLLSLLTILWRLL